MKIAVELTEDEYTALLIILGFSAGIAIQKHDNPEFARTVVRISNKLLSGNPNFIPYDENSFDPSALGFPFKKVILQ